MLYDPKWEQQTRADPFSLESLIAWLEKQPADETYCYTDIGRCLLGQYFSDRGFERISIDPFRMKYGAGTRRALPSGWNDIARGEHRRHNDGNEAEWTFGAALKRARGLRNPVTET